MDEQLCECGAPVFVKKTGECRSCYYKRKWRETADQRPSKFVPAEKNMKACSYNHAHDKLRRIRGRAAEQTCIGCGEQAREWSYRGNSEFEQSAWRVWVRDGKRIESWTTWSPNVWDYDPMCRPCHLQRDRGHTS